MVKPVTTKTATYYPYGTDMFSAPMTSTALQASVKDVQIASQKISATTFTRVPPIPVHPFLFSINKTTGVGYIIANVPVGSEYEYVTKGAARFEKVHKQIALTNAANLKRQIELDRASKTWAALASRTSMRTLLFGSTATALARTSVISTVALAVTRSLLRKIAAQQTKLVAREMADRYRRISQDSLNNLNRVFSNTLSNAGDNIRFIADVDTSNFDRAIQEYIKYSKKSFSEVVNQKAYWIALNSIKETYKADASVISRKYNEPSREMPGLTTAEAIVVSKARKEGKRLTRGEMKAEARKLINKGRKASGFLRSGWIPAVKRLAPVVQQKAGYVGRQRVSKKPKGGAQPALDNTLHPIASIWNDIKADNDSRAQNYMRVGLQFAMDKEAASMTQYVEKKLRQNAERFNRA